MKTGRVDAVLEGAGGKAIVMVQGWPDTLRIWDAQVEALKTRYRCARFTLPGFDAPGPRRAYSIDEIVETIREVADAAAPGGKVTLLLHDWGCFYGYQFATRYPDRVERVIGVDIGDAGSRANRAELGARGIFLIVAYQLWLAVAWRIGRRLGDGMARWLARLMRVPADPAGIHARMGYPYAVVWFGVAGGAKGLRSFEPACPMLFAYGEKKPVMFHSKAWAARLAARPGSAVMAFPTGHWVMLQRPREFNEAVLRWLENSGSGQ